MDLNKLKSLAKTTLEKTKEGIDKANDIRKKASAETKMVFPASNSFIQPTTVRKTVDGQFYLGLYTETPIFFEIAGFEYAGSTVTQRTSTKGEITPTGGLKGALIGGLLAGDTGAIIGSGLTKKGKVNTTSTTTSQEKPGKAVIKLRNIQTGEIKNISTKLTSAEADNTRLFFEI